LFFLLQTTLLSLLYKGKALSISLKLISPSYMDKLLSQRFEREDYFLYQSLCTEQEDAFVFLYQQCKQRCIPYALNKGANETEAEDLLQDCLAIFLVKLRNKEYTWSSSTKITSYFYRIYINQWKKLFDYKWKHPSFQFAENHFSANDDDTGHDSDFLDAESSFTQSPTDMDTSYDSSEREWIFIQLEKAFQLLKPDCQKMVHLFYVEEASLRLIAKQLQITEAFAAQKRFRCTKYLTELFHKQ